MLQTFNFKSSLNLYLNMCFIKNNNNLKKKQINMKFKENQDTDLIHKACVFHLRDLTGNRRRLVLSVGKF